MSLKVITSDFEIFDKLSKIDIYNVISFKNTPKNRKKLNMIINNINSKDFNLSSTIINNMIILEKKRNFNLNIYYRT